MGKRLDVTLEGFNYAAKQMQIPLLSRFGDLEWERALLVTSPEFYKIAVLQSGTRLLDAGDARNHRTRELLTLIYAAVFFESGRTLPTISPKVWSVTSILYPANDSAAMTALAGRVEELLDSVSEYWSLEWQWLLGSGVPGQADLSDAQIWYLYALVLCLMAQALGESLHRPKKEPEKKKEEPTSPTHTSANRTFIPTSAPTVTFDDIGGCGQAKAKFRRLKVALGSRSIWASWGATVPRGVLLWGPPGNGKTMLAKALARETGRRFFYVKSGDVVDMWYGLSPKNIGKIISDAAADGGGIVFFDEAEALFAARDGFSHEETLRMIGTFNAAVDGLERPEDVLIIFATNRRQLMDDAVVREGRVDLHIECPMPDRADRADILRVHMHGATARAKRRLFTTMHVDAVAAATEGFSGAALAETVRRVLEEKAFAQAQGGAVDLVSRDDLLAAVREQRRERTETARNIGIVEAIKRSK